MNHDKPAVLGGQPIFETLVPILRPSVPNLSEMTDDLQGVLSSGLITNAKKVSQFEAETADYLGVKHCVALSCCTSGLILSLKALGVVDGEVIVPSFTFYASVHAISWNNLTPVFVDCQLDSFNIDPVKVEQAITPKTKGVLAVHLYGNPVQVKQLQQLADQYNLPLLYDAAHAFGSQVQKQSVGGNGNVEVFSLSPTKLLTAGEGGLAATNDETLARKLRAARNYGDAGTYDPEMIGLNARMSEFNAVLGLHSLKGIEGRVERRNEIANLYESRLTQLPGLSFQVIESGNRTTYKDFSFLVDPEQFGLSRDKLCEALTAENIMTRKYFHPPVHRQQAYQTYFSAYNDKLPISNQISDRVVSLPIYAKLTNQYVEGICTAIERTYHHREQVITTMGETV